MPSVLSIVIPAYNEESGVGEVLTELQKLLRENDIDAEIILVDDGSQDATAQEAQKTGVRVIKHRNNRGYGASLKTGITAAKHNVVAITDADGTYPAKYLPEMLKELECADMVVGARIGTNVQIPLVRKPAKWVLNQLANYVSNAKIPDLNSGLRVFRRDVVMQYFSILPNQFSWTTTITLALHCDSYTTSYIPIDYRGRQGRSKIMPWDAGSFAILILRTAMLFKPLRVFVPMAMICFVFGVVKSAIDLGVTGDRNISSTATLMLLSSLMILLIGMLGDAMVTRMGKMSLPNVIGAGPSPGSEEEEASPVSVTEGGG